MAMMTCKHCDERHSTRADRCVNCGRLTWLGKLDHASGSLALVALLFFYFAR